MRGPGSASEIVGPRRGKAAPGATTEEVGAARLLFRFALGGAELAGEWLGAALRSIDRMPEPLEPPPIDQAPSSSADTARAVLVGAVWAAIRWRPPTTPLEKVARRTGRGLRLFAHAPGVHLMERRYRRARARVAAQLQRWAEEGACEERAGRRLARLAAPAFFELAVARLADSPELQLVIEEQSQGLAATSVASLRERSEVADRLVERVIRRVLRRPSNGA